MFTGHATEFYVPEIRTAFDRFIWELYANPDF